MSIAPINGAEFLQQAAAARSPGTGTAAEIPFKSMFQSVLKEMNELEAQKTQNAFDLAVGNIDDPAQVNIAAVKSETALQMLVQMANSILDAYSEIMRMNV